MQFILIKATAREPIAPPPFLTVLQPITEKIFQSGIQCFELRVFLLVFFRKVCIRKHRFLNGNNFVDGINNGRVFVCADHRQDCRAVSGSLFRVQHGNGRAQHVCDNRFPKPALCSAASYVFKAILRNVVSISPKKSAGLCA